jgi:hypothetical protein
MPTTHRPARILWTALAIVFAALNVWAIASAGVAGIADYLTNLGPIGILATVDLLLALLVGLTLILRDARVRQADARPYVALTLGTGSLGLLAYMGRHDGAVHEERVG